MLELSRIRDKKKCVEGDKSAQKASAVKFSRQPRNDESTLTLAPVGVKVSAQEVDIVGENAQGCVLRLSRSQGGDQSRCNGGSHGVD